MGMGKDYVNSNSAREKKNQKMKREGKKSAADEYAQAISKVVVAQICESIGFQGFQQSALNALTDIGIRYIREIGKAASSSANSLNRSQCNVFDVIQGLEDLESILGFPGGSDVGHSLSQSGVIKGMVRYIRRVEEIPFAYSIPSFLVVKKRKLDPSFAQANENPPSEHIPSWLPKFPNPEKGGIDTETIEKIKKTNAIQEMYLCNGSKVETNVESNPFLAAPLQLGEKEVPLPGIPAKAFDKDVVYDQNCHFSESYVMNVEPSLEANESEDRQKVLVNGRPSVCFKFGNSNKSLGMMTRLRNGSMKKISQWFGEHQDGSEIENGIGEQVRLENTENSPNESRSYITQS